MIPIILAVLCGLCYRIGGQSKEVWKYSDTKWRDLGCAILALIMLGETNVWLVVPTFLLLWLFLSMYHKWINRLFKKPTNKVFWFNWLVHGLCIGLALLPYGIVNNDVCRVIIYASALSASMTITSELISVAFWEEFARGSAIILWMWLIL